MSQQEDLDKFVALVVKEARRRAASGLDMNRKISPPPPSSEIVAAYVLIRKIHIGDLSSAVGKAIPANEPRRELVLLLAGEVAGQAVKQYVQSLATSN